jgi:hypothetical protein
MFITKCLMAFITYEWEEICVMENEKKIFIIVIADLNDIHSFNFHFFVISCKKTSLSSPSSLHPT